MRFFQELKRCNVYKVAAAYAVIGWLPVQIATQLLRLDPSWDPLRNDPGFQQLLAEGKELVEPNK